MEKFLDLVDVMRTLYGNGMSIEDLAKHSGLPEKDVKSVVKKGEKLIRGKRDDAMRKLKPLFKTLGDGQIINKNSVMELAS